MNKKRQRQKLRQKRQMKRGQKKRVREKKVLKAKHNKPAFSVSPTIKKVPDKKSVPLKAKIRFHIYKVIRKIRRLSCFIGKHDWKLCSGREGDPMYTCIRCWRSSKMKWGKGGSREYYDKKYEDKLGISDPKNWEKKDGEWYFKGEYVRLDKEARRRLKVILGRKKNKVIK